MDVDASLDDVLAALDVDADMNVGSDADADVDTDVDSIADAGVDVEVDVDSVEDGELEPVIAVTLMPTVKKQIVSEFIPFLHVLEQGRRTQRSRIINPSRCRKDEIYGFAGTTSPRSLKNGVTKRRASNIGYARIGTR